MIADSISRSYQLTQLPKELKPGDKLRSSAASHVDFSHYRQKSTESAQAQKTPLGIHAEYSSTRRKAKSEPTPAQLKKRQTNKRLNAAAKLLPGERIASCQRIVSPEYEYMAVRYNPADSCTGFRGLVCCESASCPHCVAKRSESDRQELAAALAAAKKRGWSVFMLTTTLRHTSHDALLDLMDKLPKAFNSAFSGRWYSDLTEEYRLLGKVKGWEITFGWNGWHPHLHILFFYEGEMSAPILAGLRKVIGVRWLESLKKHGASASMEYGISLEAADSKIAEYIAKWGREPNEHSWGVESEMTKHHLKQSRDESGLTIFEILGAAAGESEALNRLARIFPALDDEALINRAGNLYVEYFRAFKGKARLHWGKNLKKLLNLDEELRQLTEAEIEIEDQSFDMVMIHRVEAFKVTGGWTGEDRRSELLELCSAGNPYEVQRWCLERGIDCIIPDIAFEWFNQLEGRSWQSPGVGWRPVAGGRVV